MSIKATVMLVALVALCACVTSGGNSTTGADVGTLRTGDISPADARLTMTGPYADVKPTRLRAGRFGGSQEYMESWFFPDGVFVRYQSTATGYYDANALAGDRAKRLVCGMQPDSVCQFDRFEKIDKRLAIGAGSTRQSNRYCGGLVYLDENKPSSGPAVFGDYVVTAIACLPSGQKDADRAIALAAQAASSVKKDGRYLVNLAPYDLQ